MYEKNKTKMKGFKVTNNTEKFIEQGMVPDWYDG